MTSPKNPLDNAREWLLILQFAFSLLAPTEKGQARRAAVRRQKFIEKQQDKLDEGKIDKAEYDARIAAYDAQHLK